MLLITAYTPIVTFVDESCETSREEGSSPEGNLPSEPALTRQRSPTKKCIKGKDVDASNKYDQAFCSLRTAVTSNSESEYIDLFNRADSRPKTAASEHINSPLSCYHVPHIATEQPGESQLETDDHDRADHVHASNSSPTNILEHPQNVVAFSPAAFHSAPTNQNSHSTAHDDVTEREISIQPSPAASTFTAPAISMTKQEAILFRHYLENLAPWVGQPRASHFFLSFLKTLTS